MIESLGFYNYQYRKDIIDKFNISSLEELQLPLGLQVIKRVKLPKSRRLITRKLLLVYLKSKLELVTGVSCGVRKIKVRSRVRSGSKINRRHYLLNFHCDIINTRFIFNFINLLYCIAHTKKLKFNFITHLHKNELCVLQKLREKNIIFIPRYRRKKKNGKLRVSFFVRNKSQNMDFNLKSKRCLIFFFFNRIKLLRQRLKRRKFEFED